MVGEGAGQKIACLKGFGANEKGKSFVTWWVPLVKHMLTPRPYLRGRITICALVVS